MPKLTKSSSKAQATARRRSATTDDDGKEEPTMPPLENAYAAAGSSTETQVAAHTALPAQTELKEDEKTASPGGSGDEDPFMTTAVEGALVCTGDPFAETRGKRGPFLSTHPTTVKECIKEVGATSGRRRTANGLVALVVQNGPHNWLKPGCAVAGCDGWTMDTPNEKGEWGCWNDPTHRSKTWIYRLHLVNVGVQDQKDGSIHLVNFKHVEAMKLWPKLTAFKALEARKDPKKLNELNKYIVGTRISWHVHVAFRGTKYTLTMYPPDREPKSDSDSDKE